MINRAIEFHYETDPSRLKRIWQSIWSEEGVCRQLPPEFYDPFWMPDYLIANRHIENGEPGVIYHISEACFFWYPFILRPLPEEFSLPVCRSSGTFQGKKAVLDYYDITSAYGYGGPLMDAATDTDYEQLRIAFESFWPEFCRSHNIIAEFVRFQPMIQYSKNFWAFYQPQQIKNIVWFDLTKSEEQLWQDLHPQKKRALKKAAHQDLVFNEDWEYYPEFQQIYAQTMDRRHARSFYCFPENYFREIEQNLPLKNRWLHTVLHQGRPVSSALFFTSSSTVHYYLGANSIESRNLHSSSYLLWRTALKAKQLGYQKFILGGGVVAHDELYRFKRQFANTEVPYTIGMRIHNAEIYEQLKTMFKTLRPGQPIPEGLLFFYREPAVSNGLPLAAPSP